ncbi:MAG: hypothetical protein J3Q66DRAFT_148735 [Benniella sp.]|nr:MAG: hypothetical protein J3Q66DRAFT_148735 [Benniella sp.]
MTSNLAGQPIQAFRCRSTDEVFHIPAIMDTITEQRIVLWSDIQDVLDGAKSIRNGELVVPFMKDDELKKITPLRIAYHPGVVLEVVEGTKSCSEAPRGAGLTYDPATAESRSGGTGLPTGLSSGTVADTNSLILATANLSMAHADHDNLSRPKYLGETPREAHSVIRAHNHLHSSYFESILLGQEMQAVTIKQSMDVHFDRLLAEMDKNKELQEQVLRTQQQMDIRDQQMQQLQQQTREELLEKQQEIQKMQQEMDEKQDRILQMQQQALDRLAIIQNRVQALLVQTYELHEYPIPRLFIVLPKVMRRRDKLMNPFSERFRLYFLCECGTHTMPDGCKTPHEVHLAKHEGYDLEKPTEFFEKYGTYLLAMMQMVKYGVMAAGLVVPPLASLKIVDEIAQSQSYAENVRKNIVPLVDDTINYLQAIKRDTETGAELTTDQFEFDKLEALEGADMRRLESYLNGKDEGRVLGNLYRIVTLEGHVKWVCFDHYRANYKESAIQQLREIVEIHQGEYIEEIGRINIIIATSIQARQFYDALIKARGIQELEITLGWDATMDDLRALAKAVTTANVIRLTVDGFHLQGPAFDIANRSRRYDAIIQLASNGRIQSLQLKNFDDFFSRVSNPALVSASKLRMFSTDSNISSQDVTIKSFNHFLEKFQSLASVDLKFQEEYPIKKATSDVLKRLHKLESLNIDRGNFSFTSRISESMIKDMKMVIKRLSDLGIDDCRFIKQGHLTQLAIEYTPQQADEDLLQDIIRCNPGLRSLQIGCKEERYFAVIKLIISTRAAHLQQGGLIQLQSFELTGENLVRFIEDDHFDNETHIYSCLAFVEGAPTFDMHTQIQLPYQKLITEQEPTCSFIREYGWSIVHLKIPWAYSDGFLATLTTLNDTISKKAPQPEQLGFYSFFIGDSRSDDLDKVVKSSQSFSGRGLLVKDFVRSGLAEKALSLLHRFEKLLELLGEGSNTSKHYYLHENPLPRLFVVLPVAIRDRNRALSLRPDRFRLFFLCECGQHTAPGSESASHEIHLANHGGYELDKPYKFFKNYGSCVLSMMYMVKYRIRTGDLVVPTLEKIVDGVGGAPELQERLKNNIARLVDDTIEFLENLGNINEPRIELATNRADVNTPDVLPTGADLKHLDSYLKVKDRERTPGNLFKIFTLEGHIKWVCFDHYRCGHRESAFNKLREVLRFNRGIFIEEQGKVEVKVVSSNVATQFYDAMTEARKVQELDITLEWDVSMDDLRAFANAVTKANVVSLIMNGSHFKGPTRDAHNRNRRFEPILQLASNGRIQSLQLDGFDDFFSRINNIPPVADSKLRAFLLRWNGPYKDKSVNSFYSFLASCTNLTTVKLKCHANHPFDRDDSNAHKIDLEVMHSIHIKTSRSHTDLYTSQGTGSEHSLATGNWSTHRRLPISKNGGPIARNPSWSRLSEIHRGAEGSPYDEASGNAYDPHLLGLPQDRPTLQWRKISNAPMTRNTSGVYVEDR